MRMMLSLAIQTKKRVSCGRKQTSTKQDVRCEAGDDTTGTVELDCIYTYMWRGCWCIFRWRYGGRCPAAAGPLHRRTATATPAAFAVSGGFYRRGVRLLSAGVSIILFYAGFLSAGVSTGGV